MSAQRFLDEVEQEESVLIQRVIDSGIAEDDEEGIANAIGELEDREGDFY